jgi:uncharacterized protein YegP (UPF0339 family)
MIFEIFQGKNEHFHFRAKAANNKVILQSEGYPDKRNAKKAIKSIVKGCGGEMWCVTINDLTV